MMPVNRPEGEIAQLCTRMRTFIDAEVVPAESVLGKQRQRLDQRSCLVAAQAAGGVGWCLELLSVHRESNRRSIRAGSGNL